MSEQMVETAGRTGPGNPNARRVAQLRRRLLSRITDEEMDAIFAKLIELATDGDLGAIKVVLQYTIGKPGPVSELDCAFLADSTPQASAGQKPPVAAPPQQGTNVPRSPAGKPDLMRQIEQAIQMPQTLVNLPPTVPAMAGNGRR